MLESPISPGFNFAGQQLFRTLFEMISRVHVICLSRASPVVNAAIEVFNIRGDKSPRLV